MQSLKSHPAFLYSLLNHLFSNSARPFLSSFSTGSLSIQGQYSKETTSLIDYLNANFKFTKCQSIYISKRASGFRSPQKTWSVLNFFKQIGFSEAQIQSTIRQRPQILFSHVDKTLRPKIELLQLLGFEGSELCEFVSNDSTILTLSLKKSLVPSVEAIRKIVQDEKDFIQVVHKSSRWIFPKYQIFVDNITFLESCGIVGSQLSMLLKCKPTLLTKKNVRERVLRAVDLGFHENSKMLVHALSTISSLSYKTFRRKLELIQYFGFSKDESLKMFQKAPYLPRVSEKKLKVGMEFFLHTVMLPKSALVHQPKILMYSMEGRVLPRYRVFQLLISRNLCKKVPSYIHLLCLSETRFMNRVMSRFRENAESLLTAYKGPKGHYLKA